MSESTGSDRRVPRRTTVVVAGVLLAVVVGLALGPWPASLGDRTVGDADLSARLAAEAGPGRVGLAAAVVGPDGVRVAAAGEDGHDAALTPDTPMEVGSITKTFTGTMLADMVRRGVVRPDERVRDLVPDRPWRPGGGGDLTLEELASHRSGLPPEATSVTGTVRNYLNGLFGLRPKVSEPDEVFAAADGDALEGRGVWSYSNLGMSLLGHALATREGTPYPELLRSQVTGPFGMDATVVPDGIPPVGAASGHDTTGRPVQDWIDPGEAPAGSGVYTTATDMAAYARAVLDGRPPTADATTPRWPAGTNRQIGYAWYTRTIDGRPLLWHDGRSGGTSTVIVVDRNRGQAAVVLGNTDEGVDDLAFSLVGIPTPARSSLSDLLASPTGTLLGLIGPLFAGGSLLAAARGGWGRRPSGTVSRARVVSAAGTALLLFAVVHAFATPSWLLAPFWLAGCGLAGAGAGLAVVRWRSMEPDEGPAGVGRRMVAAGMLVAGLVFAVGVGGALV